jgi:hypothetical protein
MCNDWLRHVLRRVFAKGPPLLDRGVLEIRCREESTLGQGESGQLSVAFHLQNWVHSEHAKAPISGMIEAF